MEYIPDDGMTSEGVLLEEYDISDCVVNYLHDYDVNDAFLSDSVDWLNENYEAIAQTLETMEDESMHFNYLDVHISN